MSGIEQRLVQLREQGIKLWVEGDKLRVRAREGALGPELTAELKARKGEILALLSPMEGIAPLPPRESYPLSPAQRRLWVLSQMAEGSCAYNIPLHQFLEGPLDRVALAVALHRLVQRHESLRTRFATVGGEPRQVVDPSLDVPLSFQDLSRREDPEAAARQLGREEARRPFDLERGPLLRAGVLRLSELTHVLLLSLHHIVADGISIAVLNRDLSRFYEAESTGRADGLPPLAFGYPAYAVWQEQFLAGDAVAPHRRYWHSRLGGELPVLNLPTDHPRPPLQTYGGHELSFTLPPDRAQALREFCRQRNASLFMLLHAALKTLLHAYTGQEDIIIGCATAGRDQAGLEDQIGYYLNTLALRSSVRAEQSFEQFFRQIKQETAEAFDHQFYPFDRLLTELQVRRDLSRFPLFDVMLVLQNQAEPGLVLGGLRARPVFEHPGTSKFDLTFCFKDTPEGLILGIEYNTDLFLRTRISRMGAHFGELLASILDHPEQALGRLNILPAEERARIAGFNSPLPPAAGRQTLVERFEAQVAAAPEAIALVWPEVHGEDRLTLSYDALNRRANQLAHRLMGAGVGPGVLVGLRLERSFDMLVALLAVLKAGGAYLPLDTAHPEERLSFILEDGGAALLITQAGAPGSFSGPVLSLDELRAELGAESGENPAPRAGAEDLAYVIYTSGSTGRPKGVPITHHQVTRLFEATDALFRFGPQDAWTLFHSYAFDFSVWEIFGALLHGGRLVVPPLWLTRSPEAFYRMLAEEGVTVLNQTPSAFKQLIQVEQEEEGLPALSLRTVVFGGEALDPSSLRPWFQRHGDKQPGLVNMYGITETTVHVSYRELSSACAEERASPIGRPIADLQVHLLDRGGRPVPIGFDGEIHVGGAGVGRGYLNRPELSAERFVVGPDGGVLYRSGDLGRYREDGDILYLGRMDQQVQIRGYRVELGEIEACLAAHPAIAQAAVDLRPDPAGDPRLLAWVVCRGGWDTTPAALRGHLAERLPDYMIPARFMALDRLALTANGKLDRKALVVSDQGGQASEAYDPPQTTWECAIAGLWQELLEVPRVGVQDNFFTLGGHSLKATQFIARLRQDTGARLDLIDVFRQPQLGALADLAAQRAAQAAQTPPGEAPREVEAIGPMTDAELEMLND